MQDRENFSDGLSEGLGQKIVEALQEQSEQDTDATFEVASTKGGFSANRTATSKAINVASDNYVLSENITKLMRLVNELPTSVDRKAGALIIKQTMEAMGVSMKTLMVEAKQVQENINGNIRTCMADIEEARNSIRQFEDQITSYKNLSGDLNDLLGLFIVSDKEF